ncbi:hypothetical protein BDV32DRAFT_129021 [Aspergillus pseudonomiae]|uniref:Uncharacterized protein n=1 Tax=Aspergillus pseudonomiae TaxID=1506151 RepID=A0A5N6HRG9_9EURO|nr:uncharacterized protein BDV37DRAFT_210566 [Aspergillus pseudonomiae]KAB8256434.1 hypothetical protein BDV32DRAFT_129021 [Aspergillus pseudonomiae]KAE8400273.1 hypothetical protein BDV37DRAFT_210566 [Aspergillus pseudonomiae]
MMCEPRRRQAMGTKEELASVCVTSSGVGLIDRRKGLERGYQALLSLGSYFYLTLCLESGGAFFKGKGTELMHRYQRLDEASDSPATPS